jgi:hypothetical protein
VLRVSGAISSQSVTLGLAILGRSQAFQLKPSTLAASCASGNCASASESRGKKLSRAIFDQENASNLFRDRILGIRLLEARYEDNAENDFRRYARARKRVRRQIS